MTEAEKRLWYYLRAHRFLGTKFKRQKSIGPYIVDFACPALRLVIEIDGGQHSEEAEYDRRRDIWLSKHGYTVLRFWNNEVTENMEGVLERIADAVKDQAPSPPSPLPQAGEGCSNSSPAISKSGEGCVVPPSPPVKREGCIEITPP